MRALMKKGRGLNNVGIEELEEPSVSPFEIKVKIHAAGICGTDLHIIADEYPANYPVTLGHEYSGTVVDVGSEVTNFQIGDHVVSLTAVVTCGKCEYCNEGLLMLCEERKSIGSGVHGAFTEYITIPANLAFHIPENVTLDEAALCEPLSCMVRCVIERGSVSAGDYVLVSGPGTIGLLTMQVARASGGNVVVIGTSADRERLLLAKELGSFDTIIIDEEDLQERVKQLTNGKGFDVAFECAGVEPSSRNCLQLLKKTGLYVQVGLYGKDIKFDMDLALTKEINITNGYASERTSWVRALKLLEKKQINVLPLISMKMPLENWEEAMEKVRNKSAFKVLLSPHS